MPKSTRPSVRIHNVETNEIIDREMNDEEFAEHNALIEAKLLQDAELQAKIAQREIILQRLNITAEEAALLLG
jgi:hypothetical protein